MHDVNLFVYAHRPESPRHAAHRAWLAEALGGIEPVGISELVLSGFLRIVTNHRVYREPTSRSSTARWSCAHRRPFRYVRIPGIRQSSPICRRLGARADVVPDAYHAALAIEHGATWITTDRGFGRFPGLRWSTALDG